MAILFLYPYMNEVEELALDSLATGGPKEVLTEQANNNPEVPSVEPSAIPEEKKNEAPVNVDPVSVDSASEENVIQKSDTPFSQNSNIVLNNLDPDDELENPYLEENFMVNETGSILTADNSPKNVNLARQLGFSNVKAMIKWLEKNGESLPVFGDWIKEHKLANKKKQQINELVYEILDNKNLSKADKDKIISENTNPEERVLSPEEQIKELKKEIDDQGITYLDDENPYILIGNDDIDAVTKELAQDPMATDGLLGGIRVIGKKRGELDPDLRKIPDNIEINKRLTYIYSKYAEAFKAQKGGVEKLSQEMLDQLADMVMLSDEKALQRILSTKPGDMLPLPYIRAMQFMYNAENARLDALIQKAIEDNSDVNVFNAREQFEVVANLHLKMSGVKTDIARALNSFRYGSDLGPEQRVVQTTGRPKDFEFTKAEQTDGIKSEAQLFAEHAKNYLDNNGGKANTIKFFKALQELPYHSRFKLQKEFHKHAKTGRLAKYFQAFNEFFVNALLTSPITHAKNVIGNSIMIVKDVAEDYSIGAVNSTLQVLGRENNGMKLKDVNDATGAMIMSAWEAMYAFAKVGFGDGSKPRQLNKNTKLENRSRSISGEKLLDDPAGKPYLAHFFDVSGNVINKSTELLDAEDTFFKVLTQRYAIKKEAIRSAKSRGLQGEKFQNYVAEFIADPPEEALMKSQKEADYRTFQEELGDTAKAVQKVINNTWGLRYMVPFFKTPYNIARVTFRDGTLLGIASSEFRRVLQHGTRDEKAKLFARQASAMGIMTFAFALANDKVVVDDVELAKIEGGATKESWRDKNKRQAQKLRQNKGIRSYSFRVKNEDGSYSYRSFQGLEPFSSWLGIGADVNHILSNPEYFTDEERDKALTAFMFATVNSLTSKTFAQGINNMFQTLSEPEENFVDTLEQIALGYVPNILVQSARVMDDYQREAKTFTEKLMKRIPGLREGLAPDRTLHGKRVPEQNDNIIWPMVKTDVETKKMTNLEKDWFLFQEAPEGMTREISFGGGSFKLEGQKEIDFLYRIYANEYNQNMERLLRDNSEYQAEKQAWIDSDQTDVEARKQAINEANSIVLKLRKKALGEIFKDPFQFAGEDKQLAKNIKAQMQEAIDKANKRKLRKRGIR